MTNVRHALCRGPRDPYWLVLGIVLIAALALRLYGLDWDDGADLHPDEMFVAKIVLIDRIHLTWPPSLADLLDPAVSGLNPRSADPITGEYREFPYGALPLLVTDGVAALAAQLSGINWNAPERAYLVGRSISALLSALTILPIAAIGRALGGRSLGLLAACFAAIAPMSLQLAHFFTTDSWLTFFVACCLWACMGVLQRSGKAVALAGCTYGLAMACKGSVFTLAVPIAGAIALTAWQRHGKSALNEAIVEIARNGILAAVTALAGFALFEPYAIVRPGIYLQSLRTQAEIVGGAFDVPFTRIYVDTVPVLYQLEQFLRWGYGPVAGLLSLVGLFFMGIAARRGSPHSLILLSWVAVYAGVLIVAEAKFLRYLEPLSPVLAVAAGVGILKLRQVFCARHWRLVSRAAVPAAFGLALVWTGAFVSVYAHENPRVAATKWIYATIPPGTRLTAEYWDDSLPRSISFPLSPAALGLGTISLDLYRDLPPEQAAALLHDQLRGADFVVQSSHRVEDAINAAPWRYPVQERFYDLLARGFIGFSPVASFDRLPSFGSLDFDDRHADESFINYDHPAVSIYKKAEEATPDIWRHLFSWAEQRPWQPSRHALEPTLQLPGPVEENPSVDDARWSAAVTSNSAAALLIWFVLLVVLTVVGFPLAKIAFQAFPDRGWGLSRVVAMCVAAYLVWIGSSVHFFQFRVVWVLCSLASVAAIGWIVHWWLRHQPQSNARVHPVPRICWHVEAAFWSVFAIFLAFRLILPDGWHPIWGGEKPMEFALINAIGRSAYFPPYDPWFADGYVNYYYYGFYLMAFLMKAVGIPSEIGFNLALPTVMGLLASSGFSLGAALSAKLTRTTRFAAMGGWATVATICLVSNLSAVRGLLAARPAVFDPFLYWTWGGSRVIDYAINEFPYFSGLYADLHAHVVALPLTVAIIALCFALVQARLPIRGTRAVDYVPLATQIMLIAIVLGSLSATNAWDVPIYALLSLASWLMATAAIGDWKRRAVALAVGAVTIGVGAWLLFLPFHQHFVALFSRVALVRDPTDFLQFLTHFGVYILTSSFGLATLLTSQSVQLRIRAGYGLIAFLALLVGIGIAAFSSSTVASASGNALIWVSLVALPVASAFLLTRKLQGDGSLMGTSALIVVGGATVLGLAMVFLGRSVLGLLLPFAGVAIAGWMVTRRVAERFVCLLAAAAFCTAAGVELVVVADDLIDSPFYRMNTVFKFYNQVWILLAVVSASLLVLMLRDLLMWRSAPADRQGVLLSGLAPVGVVVSVVTLLATLTYPALATVPRLEQRFDPGTPSGSLNALGWMREGVVPVLADAGFSEIVYAGDAAAINWLWQNVTGTPVIAEASIGPYRCNGSRISAATGLPTIIGWERHEQQQRYPDTLPGRVADVRTLYTSPDPEVKADILYRYNVAYVIVGDLERFYPMANNECTPTGSEAGITAFELMVGKELEVAFQGEGTTIYRVLPPGVAS